MNISKLDKPNHECDDCGAPDGEWSLVFNGGDWSMILCTPCIFGVTVKIDRALSKLLQEFATKYGHSS